MLCIKHQWQSFTHQWAAEIYPDFFLWTWLTLGDYIFLETFPKFVPAPVPEVSMQQNKICVVSIFYSCLGWCLFSEFSRQTHPPAESLTNDCKSMITVFGFFYSHAPGIVVTAWWESTHVLIPIGFLSWRWLESLLFITDVFFLFLFGVEKKMILHLTILVCIWWQYNRETESSLPLFCAMLCCRCTCNCTCTWN